MLGVWLACFISLNLVSSPQAKWLHHEYKLILTHHGSLVAASSCEVVFERPDVADNTETRSRPFPISMSDEAVKAESPLPTPEPKNANMIQNWKLIFRGTAILPERSRVCLYLLALLLSPSRLRTVPSSADIVRSNKDLGPDGWIYDEHIFDIIS